MQTLITQYFATCIRAIMYEWSAFLQDPFSYDRSFDRGILWIITDREEGR